MPETLHRWIRRLRIGLAGRGRLATWFASAAVAVSALVGHGAGQAQAAPSPICLLNPMFTAGCAIKAGAEGVGNNLAGTLAESLIRDAMAGFDRLLEWALSWWIMAPSPVLEPGSSTLLQRVSDYTFYIQVIGLIASIMFVALRMTLSTRGLVEESEELWRTLARAVFASALLGGLIALGTKASDAFSTWILKESIGEADGTIAESLLNLDVLTNQLGMTVTGLIILVALAGAFLQLVLVVIRQAMLIVVVSALPVAAASSGTGPGSQAYEKLIAWTLAFLLFKPVGAIVYMIAFTAVRSDGDQNSGQMTLLGIILLSLVFLVLPSLMRLIAPAVGGMGGAASGAAVLGAAAGAGAMGAGLMKMGGKADTAAGGGGGGSGGGGGGSSLSSRSPSPVSPAGGSGNHSALGSGKATQTAGAAAGTGAAAAAAGPVAAAMGATQGVGKAKDAAVGAMASEADGQQPNPSGSSTSSSPSMNAPQLVSGTGEHRMSQ